VNTLILWRHYTDLLTTEKVGMPMEGAKYAYGFEDWAASKHDDGGTTLRRREEAGTRAG
jgi:hypothetical protein